MQFYNSLKNKHERIYLNYKKKFSLIAAVRLLLALSIIVSVVQFVNTTQTYYLLISVILFIVFIVLLSWHQKIKYTRNLHKKLIEINESEIAYLHQTSIPFYDGKEFIDTNHLYAFDLDIFGPKSLFHHINRTASPMGTTTLAFKLTNAIDSSKIHLHQQAIKELSQKIEFRQLMTATANLADLDQKVYHNLLGWSKQNIIMPSLFLTMLRIIMPILFFSMIALAYYTGNVGYKYLANSCFLINLSVFAYQFKKIKKELIEADKIHESIKQYALLFELILKEEMQAAYLVELKSEITSTKANAHVAFEKLSQLFNNLSSIENPVGAVFFNGALLYHLGVYKNLLLWKKNNALLVEKYMHILGEFDALNAIANFAYNNPDFVFPAINNQFNINLKHCGHPLIPSKKRICNDVAFKEGQFIILTGSNMSGKSTFLRTLGINMVLANTGAPVCANQAQIHPMPVIVSMRMSDSLTDSESYFFAEVKRLKQLMDELDKQVCFVLLDEILKGTNSDDKRLGTVKVVEKMVQKKAIGAIATHDLEVCNITSSYPKNLSNNCFEVEIIDDELVFDYSLREGICKNKSASFLMNKMGII